MFFIWLAVIIAVVVVIIVLINKLIKMKRSICPKCKAKYKYPQDVSLTLSDLKWEEAKKHETKGDFKYEITYKKYYRNLEYVCKCSKCGNATVGSKRIDVYRSDSGHSLSDAEELMIIRRKTVAMFSPEVFQGVGLSQINYSYRNMAEWRS